MLWMGHLETWLEMPRHFSRAFRHFHSTTLRLTPTDYHSACLVVVVVPRLAPLRVLLERISVDIRAKPTRLPLLPLLLVRLLHPLHTLRLAAASSLASEAWLPKV